MNRLVLDEKARRVARAWHAWQWIQGHVEATPPADDGLRHPEIDAEDLLGELVVRAAHELVQLDDLDDAGLVRALVDVGLSSDEAHMVCIRHANWVREAL